MGTTQMQQKPTQPIYYAELDDDSLYNTRMPSSVRRYRPSDTMEESILQRGNSQKLKRANSRSLRTNSRALRTNSNIGITEELDLPDVQAAMSSVEVREQGTGKRFSWLAIVVGAIIAVTLLITANSIMSWWQGYQDALTYGYPRTYHFDAVVGHDDSENNKTHFILMNMDGRVLIIEFPGGDPNKARAFNGPTLYGEGKDLVPVTGEIVEEDGKQNLIVYIRDQRVVFVNDGTTFHLSR